MCTYKRGGIGRVQGLRGGGVGGGRETKVTENEEEGGRGEKE